jgi:hypothetical protein
MLLRSCQLTCAIVLGLSLSAVAPHEVLAWNLSCGGFDPTMIPSEQGFVIQKLQGAPQFWSEDVQTRTDAERKLSQRLALVYPPPQPGTAGDATLEWRHWKAMLRTHCDFLNSLNFLSASGALTRFEWLADIYLDRTPPQPQRPDLCSPETPLPKNAVEMMIIWNAYNLAKSLPEGQERTRLFQEAADLAWHLYQKWKAIAYHIQTIVHPVRMPNFLDKEDQCRVLRNGVLNDVAAALWVRWKSLRFLGRASEAESASDTVRCFPDGFVYDPRLLELFWQPAENIDDTGRTPSCAH